MQKLFWSHMYRWFHPCTVCPWNASRKVCSACHLLNRQQVMHFLKILEIDRELVARNVCSWSNKLDQSQLMIACFKWLRYWAKPIKWTQGSIICDYIVSPTYCSKAVHLGIMLQFWSQGGYMKLVLQCSYSKGLGLIVNSQWVNNS